MHALIALLIMSALAQAQPASSEQAAVVAQVQTFVDDFNKGDAKGAAATCANQTSIIDEFPPNEWHGVAACARWMHDYTADAKKNGMTEGTVTLGKAKHMDVTGDRAYTVFPVDFSFKQKGSPVKETGSLLTVVLQKVAGAWRIAAWTWSKN